jgi:hypothetical protein
VLSESQHSTSAKQSGHEWRHPAKDQVVWIPFFDCLVSDTRTTGVSSWAEPC